MIKRRFSDEKVSIHTPPWGRDVCFGQVLGAFQVSIHTPPWGRDSGASGNGGNGEFQFTRPRGGAICSSSLSERNSCFNSHAPVGARFLGGKVAEVKAVSIHTPPWGRDED